MKNIPPIDTSDISNSPGIINQHLLNVLDAHKKEIPFGHGGTQTHTVSEPVCLESAFSHIHDKVTMERFIVDLVATINGAIRQSRHQDFLIVRNTCDQITPCNQDKNKIYFEFISVYFPDNATL